MDTLLRAADEAAQQLVIRPTLQIKLLTGSGHENLPIFAPGGGDTAGYRFSSRVASPRNRCNCWRMEGMALSGTEAGIKPTNSSSGVTMSLKPSMLGPVPAATAQVARSAFPGGNVYLTLREE